MSWLTDEAGHTFTAAGNSWQCLDHPKFTPGALEMGDEGSNYIWTPDDADFVIGSNSFCVDFWLRPSVLDFGDGNRLIVGHDHLGYTTGNHAEWKIICHYESGYLWFVSTNASNGTTKISVMSSTSIDDAIGFLTNTWYHIALCVDVVTGPPDISYYRWFVNGTQLGTTKSIPSVVTGTDSNPYYCILTHTSDNDKKPITGANWSTYWAAGGSNPETWQNLNYYYQTLSIDDPKGSFRAGYLDGGGYGNLSCHIDELRFSIGTSRWTSNFTPPSSEYSVDGNTKVLMHFGQQSPDAQVNTNDLYTYCTQNLNPASMSFQVRNSGAGTLNYTISDDAAWLSCDPDDGSSTGNWVNHTVNFDASSLDPGEYLGTITITGGLEDVYVYVHLTVNDLPEGFTDPTELYPTCNVGQNAPSETFDLWGDGGLTWDWGITTITFDPDIDPWLSVDPTSGDSTGPGDVDTVTVNYDTSGLAAGVYQAWIAIDGASNYPEVYVELTVNEGGLVIGSKWPLPCFCAASYSA